MPDCFGKPAVTNSCAFYLCTRGCGCAKHPAFPAPSIFRGTPFSQSPGRSCRGNVDARHCGPTGPREARPDDRLHEAIQTIAAAEVWIALPLAPLAMTGTTTPL